MKWLLAILMLIPVQALAEEPVAVPSREVQSIPPGDDKITSVAEGEKAPYDGQLFSQETALRWANWLEQYQLKGEEDLLLQRRICTIEYQYRDRKAELEKEASDRVEEDLRSRLLASEERNTKLQEEMRNPPWYKTRAFSVVVGAAGASALIISGAVIVDAVK